MTLNHLVLVGGGHTNVLLMQKWLMHPKLMPDVPITIISRDYYLVYSSMYPSVISNSIPLKRSLIDISSLANNVKISFVKSEVMDVDFHKKQIILKDRPLIQYSKIILNCGASTKIPDKLQNLVRNKIAFPIRPFFQSYKFIKSEDDNNSLKELPFVIVGSGLGAIEIAFSLRKRWGKRKLIIVCDQKKINNKFLASLENLNITVKKDLNFLYKKILLCTGNSPQTWIKNNNLQLDNKGRIITDANLRAKDFYDIYAVGDCSSVGVNTRKSSGILAVKSTKTLSENLLKDMRGRKLNKWAPQKHGLQIVNLFNNKKPLKAFAVYGKFVLGPNTLLWYLKNKLDYDFLRKFKSPKMNTFNKSFETDEVNCRGCAAKIPQNLLNDSLKKSKLNKFADSPEDSSEIFRSDKEVILQSLDGFPSLISDPWLNAKITTLHACSDLWACGAKVKSGQIFISIPKVDKLLQKYIFTQSLDGVRSIFDELGGEIIGGHTYESRNLPIKPYSLGVELGLSVQGILKIKQKPWKKNGMKPGDILLMSRPLGIGIFFAAQMRSINLFESYKDIFKNLISSQQKTVINIRNIEEKLGKNIVNASTDITGYGFLNHLNEMLGSSNLKRRKENLQEIQVVLDLNSFRAYTGILDLIRCGVRSSLFNENSKILDLIFKKDHQEQLISFNQFKNDLKHEELNAKKELLCDPQTCGPLLVSCDPNYHKYFDDNWYKVGVVKNKDI